MSKDLTVIEGLVEQTSTQNQALKEVLKEIKNDKQEMINIRKDVAKMEGNVKSLSESVESDVYLKPAQANRLYDEVGQKARELTRLYYPSLIGDDSFPKRVGVAKIKIWSDFKRTYGVSKYYYLPRKYYESARKWVDRVYELNNFGE